MAKVSWLDSVNMPSNIHITSDGVRTLCGYTFKSCFEGGIWKPYRVGKHAKHTCQTCVFLAKQNNISLKVWHESIPERDTTELPQSSKIKHKINKGR